LVGRVYFFFVVKQKTASEVPKRDWSSDVCSPDLLRNPDAHYHPMTWAEIDALTPGLRWEAATRRAGAPAVNRVIVGQPDFLRALARILAETPAEDVRDYLRFQAIAGCASVLNATTAKAAFEFEGVVLTGAKQQRSLQERALKMQDGALGDLLGKEYVARRFSPAQRERFRLVCENVRTAFAARIRKLEWMDADTQAWALRKLAAIKLRVGYPDKFRGYEGVEIRADGLAQNLVNVSKWSRARTFARVGGAPEREEWGMRPYTVNAYYSPMNNEIGMPAGPPSRSPGPFGARVVAAARKRLPGPLRPDRRGIRQGGAVARYPRQW